MTSGTNARTLSSIASLAMLLTWLPVTAQPAKEPRAGICMREGGKLVGREPVTVGRTIRAPKRIKDVTPDYPELPPGTVGPGRWIGEFLLGAGGKVVRVWTIREPAFYPPFPAFNEAIVAAVRQWEFEPVLVKSEPTPVCMTVDMIFEWQ